jgi:hypothetical protein
MAIDGRELLCLTGATAAVAACPQMVRAEAYPSRPVRILVGYAAGGGVDIAARLIGQWLSERFQQQFVVENRTGAATNIATEAVIRSPPDSYTLLLVNAANAINATYYESLSFNFMRDIAPVAGIGRFPYFMAANPAFPANNVREFIAYAKANPRKANMGTGGAGGPDHASGGIADGMVQNTICTCPLSRSMSAGVVPRYGTCVIWMPVISWSSSASACSPTPLGSACGKGQGGGTPNSGFFQRDAPCPQLMVSRARMVPVNAPCLARGSKSSLSCFPKTSRPTPIC